VRASGGIRRKEAARLQRLGLKRPRAAARPLKTSKPFCFLDLPAELRNLVYEKVAKHQIAILEKGELTDNSELLDVNIRIRNEYYPILLHHASRIMAEVVNFDFQKVVTFLNRLSDADINALPSTTKSATRPIEIKLTFDQRMCQKKEILLKRWLNRAGHPTKKGTTLNISYSLSTCHRLAYIGFPNSNLRRGDALFSKWREALDTYIKEKKDARAGEEAKKIRAALGDRV
jgi:hypothetical protein